MATLLDAVHVLQVWGFYTVILPFFLVAAIVYGVLAKLKPFGERQGVNIIISIVVGLIFISFTKAVTFVSSLIPMLTAMFVVLLLIIMIFVFMGVPYETIGQAMKSPAGYGIMIVMFVLFIFMAISAAFPETYYITHPEATPNATALGTPAPGTNPSYDVFVATTKLIYNPVIVSLIIMMIIFAVAAYYITYVPKAKG